MIVASTRTSLHPGDATLRAGRAKSLAGRDRTRVRPQSFHRPSALRTPTIPPRCPVGPRQLPGRRRRMDSGGWRISLTMMASRSLDGVLRRVRKSSQTGTGRAAWRVGSATVRARSRAGRRPAAANAGSDSGFKLDRPAHRRVDRRRTAQRPAQGAGRSPPRHASATTGPGVRRLPRRDPAPHPAATPTEPGRTRDGRRSRRPARLLDDQDFLVGAARRATDRGRPLGGRRRGPTRGGSRFIASGRNVPEAPPDPEPDPVPDPVPPVVSADPSAAGAAAPRG